ncbi:MAG: hypothetical protein HFJ91_09365 [Muribaculaceae bacterium]|nr:hypothetical protein [Muribaculaceae bacterium]
MKALRFIIIFSTLAIIMIGCRREHPIKELERAYEMCKNDEIAAAAVMVDSLSLGDLKSLQDSALYAFIVSYTRHKSGMDEESDSLIRIAYKYYGNTSDDFLSSRLNLVRGYVYYNSGNFKDAMGDYLKAEDFAKEYRDSFMLGMIYLNMARVYYKYNFFNEESHCMKKSIECLRNQNKPKHLVQSIIGYCYSLNHLRKANEALEAMKEIPIDSVKSWRIPSITEGVIQIQASANLMLTEYEKAHYFFDLLANPSSWDLYYNISSCIGYGNMAGADSIIERYDLLATDSAAIPNIYWEEKNNYLEAYKQMVREQNDDISDYWEKALQEVSMTVSNYNTQKLLKKQQKGADMKLYIITSSLICLIFIISLLILYYKKKNDNNELLNHSMSLKENLESKTRELLSKQDELIAKNSDLETLKKGMDMMASNAEQLDNITRRIEYMTSEIEGKDSKIRDYIDREKTLLEQNEQLRTLLDSKTDDYRTLIKTRQKYINFITTLIHYIDSFCHPALFDGENNSKPEESVIKSARKVFAQFKKEEQSDKIIEDYINACHSGLIESLRITHKDINEDDILLYKLIFIGLTPKAIALIMDTTVKAYYNRKNRLKAKIGSTSGFNDHKTVQSES